MKINTIGHLVKTNPIRTQFPKSQNERKLTYNKGLQKKRRFHSPKKQSQNKPNPPARYAIRNTRYEIQTQSNPISLLPKSPRLPHFSLSSFGRCFHLRCSHQYWLGSSRTNSSIALVYSAVIHSNGSSLSAHSSGKITRLTPISK